MIEDRMFCLRESTVLGDHSLTHTHTHTHTTHMAHKLLTRGDSKQKHSKRVDLGLAANVIIS